MTGRRALAALARAIWHGLIVYGASVTGTPWRPDPPRPLLDRPPAGHPERLAPEIIPDERERRLWAELRALD